MGVDLPSYYATVACGLEATIAARDAVPEGVLFVSFFPNEVVAISKNPSVMQSKASAMRQGRTVVDNLYSDDGPLTAEQMKRALFLAWNMPRL